MSFVGYLDYTNPNDVFLTSFSLADASSVSIQTWGFGGTVNAPGGTNAQGQAIVAGGFDPYASLFAGSGAGAAVIASDDGAICPPGHAAPVCADSTLTTGLLAAGTYTLALTLPFNDSFAENYGGGTLGDGFVALDSSYDDGTCVGSCSNASAVDIRWVDVGPVTSIPEPPVWPLLVASVAGWSALPRRRGAAGPRLEAPPDSSVR